MLSPVMSPAMSLMMSCQTVRRQLKDKFRVIWDRNTQTNQGAHIHTDTLLISMLHFLSRPPAHRHMDTHHTVYCPHTHRLKLHIYTALIHSILYTWPRSCEVISVHMQTHWAGTQSLKLGLDTHKHTRTNTHTYTCEHSGGFASPQAI